jgi:membrane-bound metal-dependent hydrolase YbcI (DUF457 family)
VPGDRAWRAGRSGNASRSSSLYVRAGGTLTLVCVALGCAADIDLLWGSHREYTHSVGAVIVTAICVAIVAYRSKLPALRVTLMCAGAYATHVVTDWLGGDARPPYGIRALWPFDDGWYISPVIVFKGTQRFYQTLGEAVRVNAAALAGEVLIFAPIVVALWLLRVRVLNRERDAISATEA